MSDDRCHVAAGTLHPCSQVARVLAEGGDTAACFRWLREGAGEVLWCLACGARIEGVRGDDGATARRGLARGATISPTES